MRHFFSLLFLALSIALAAQSQCICALDKVNKGKRLRIQNGDFVKVVSKADTTGYKSKLEGQVMVKCDGTFIFPQGDRLNIAQIEKISVPRGGLWGALKGLGFLGGKVYFGVASFNGLVNNDSPIIPSSVIPVLLVSEGIYFAAKAHQNRWFKIKEGKREIKMIDLRP